MKSGILILFLLVAIPPSAFAHGEVFFPKLYSPAELPNTGFVFLNPDFTTAMLNVYLMSPSGRSISESSLTIAAKGQTSILGSELFPQATAEGWVYVITSSEGMQAFWLNYDAELTSLDGAEAAQYETIGTDQIVPLVAGNAELNVINPNFAVAELTIGLFGADGEIAPAFRYSLPVAGGFQGRVSSMFPSADMTQARYIRVRSAGLAIASSVSIRGFMVATESVIVNGVNVSPRNEATFPHVINGTLAGARYTTVLGVTNASAASQRVAITFNPDGGIPITVNRTIAANGALRETAESLFGLPLFFQSGWVRVTGVAPIVGFAAYADNAAGGLAVVPAATPQTHLFFSHIAAGPPQWQTGLAILNTEAVRANVDVFAVTPGGALIGRTSLTLEPGKKMATVIHELIPETRGVNGGYVYVRTSNTLRLYGIELFYTEDLKVLSNVAAGKLAPTVTYTPPSQ